MNPTPHPLMPRLREGLTALGLTLDDAACAQLLQHLDLIAKWNKVYNLTAVRNPLEMLTHHLLDSLSLVLPLRAWLDRQAPAATPGVRLMDVGAGAGLPGVALAVACPALSVTCVDTVAKKATFIRQVGADLRLPPTRLRAEHARVEQMPPHGAAVVTCRAFASLLDFTALTRQHLAPDGVWAAMKGRHPADEIAALPPDVEVFHVEPLQVPGLDAERCLVWMRLRSL